jgi:hypothetical protein
MRNTTRWVVKRGGKQDQMILKSKWDSIRFKSRRYSEPGGAQVRMASKNTRKEITLHWMLLGNYRQRPFELSPLPIAMIIVVDPSIEPIPPGVTRTENPAAGTPVSTSECRDWSLADRAAGTDAGTVKVNLDPMYDEQAEALLWNSAITYGNTTTIHEIPIKRPALHMRCNVGELVTHYFPQTHDQRHNLETSVRQIDRLGCC